MPRGMSSSVITMSSRFDAKKILIILHGSIGDVTRALPLANVLRRGFPGATLAWAVEPAALPLVQHHAAIDEVILFDRSRWWKELWPFLRRIRTRRFDLVLDLQRHFKSGFISRWSGAPNRLGFNKRDAKEFNWIFNNRFIPMLGDSVSKLDHYLKFAEYLGIEPYPIEWNIDLTVEEQARVDRLVANSNGAFAVLFVGSRWESKRWFPVQIAECARMIRERFSLGVVFLGNGQDEPFAKEAEEISEIEVINLTGRTSLRDAVGIIARARIAVGPDTGLMHLAAAVGTPVVSLWGATSPARTGPYGFDELAIQGKAPCAPCYLKQCPIGRICMQSIGVEEIRAKLDIVLSRPDSKVVSRVH